MERPTVPMNNKNLPIRPILIEKELKDSFLDYAMSVVVSRALPDIRDGLKPVHRRILYTMHQLGFFYNKPYHKSVRVVGDVLGKFHPHGDQAVYQSMVGLIQDFSKRYPLLDGQGNWGSVDGDNAAAMRYTEVRMARIAQEILADIEKETVAFVPNFDESTVEPVVLPSRLPNLLINGVAGIAVGMATSIPPHNLGEVVDALLAMLHNEFMTDEELFTYIPGPDFPTGGIICGRAGIVKAYKTGRGNVILRGVAEFEEKANKGTSIVITQLPYQVNKADLTIKIADLVKNKIIDGISNIKDESDKKGMRLVIDLKRGEIPSVTLNQLYKHTNLQTSVSILMLGLLDNQPLIFSLRELLNEFLYHRQQIIYRRTQHDLSKAQEREHILAGFVIALSSIDEVIALIKKSPSANEAIILLNKRFLLSEKQGKAILEMRLQRLTGLEQEKIYAEMDEIKVKITYFRSILENEPVLRQEIVKELQDIKENYNDARRTKIEGAIDILTEADLIPDEEAVVTLTMKGYVKRVPLEAYGVQRRGGKGKMGLTALEGDIVQDVFVAKAHDMLLFFTNLGRVYSLNTFEVPEASRVARGRAIINLLPLQDGETVVKLLPSRIMAGKFMVMVTREGVIKRTDASDFAKIRATGIRAITLREGDELVFCSLSNGENTIVLATAKGQGIRFKETEVRSMGRQASGVMGIRVKKNDRVVGMEVISDHGEILFATQNGYGKKVKIEDFRIAHRGGMGVRTIPTTGRNGEVIGLSIVHEDSHILLIDQAGKIICLSAKDIRAMGRQAKGVRLIRLDASQKLHNVVAFESSEDPAADVEEGGLVIEKRTLPVAENGDEQDEEDDEDELDEEEDDSSADDIEYDEEDSDDVDADEEVEL
jgi:DNA gyrase subunit A